jgi:uncharacterized protein YjiS (DUF1127 family)
MNADSSVAKDAFPPFRPARSLLSAGIGQLLLWQDRAAQRRRLMSLDEHRLADIGRTRAEVGAEIKKPFWRP